MTWTEEVFTKDGEKVAMNELALFFNNATILYGWQAFKEGMTKQEALDGLEAIGFDPLLAEAFLKKVTQSVSVAWQDGKLRLLAV